MLIATWNINSIKVRQFAVEQYLIESSPDVLVLQETKSQDESFPEKIFSNLGYSCIFCGQKTYNGVAILSKTEPKDIELNPVTTKENEKRSIAATYNDIRIINLYVVNGQDVGTPKFDYKMRWLNALHDYIKKIKSNYSKIIILGDFNIAPRNEDTFDHVATDGQILCSPKERQKYQSLLDLGFYDLFLSDKIQQHPPKTFSWWDYRSAAFHNNIGYRIDLILGNEAIQNACTRISIDRHTRYKTWCKKEPRTSDHAPVLAELEL
ncbi:MAG: exodeoxyribonuclease III [Gammaproteobacteria bacterium]|nr:exodeoxyribonuclease III [Gammaproteobacteria bacterium]|tara:strand:- start:262 stop:1056 length:795 start_codon:yes stop_codon:yes gene_type:complete